jgi:hypothetical protein
MTFPKSRIEIWHGANMLYQLDSHAVSLHTKEVLNGVGTFSFTLPTAHDITRNLYSNVALNDLAKLWINYDTITGDPLTQGPICQMQSSTMGGFLRTFLCKNQGEILTRRFKTKNYVNVDAATIVTEWAVTDLGLGISLSGDASDAYHESFFVDHESYLDCLNIASDFWADAAHIVKKDFYVDVNNNLVWKTRPFRPPGTVETLGIETNILQYTVQPDMSPVKNYLWIYGRLGKIQNDPTGHIIDDGRKNPTDGDLWTESLTDWTAASGTLSAPGAGQVVGAAYIHCVQTAGSPRIVDFYHVNTIASVYGLEGYQTINFWLKFTDTVMNDTLKILAPDASNYFVLSLPSLGFTPTDWTRYSYILGQGNEFNAVSNPSGQWTIGAGAPDWHNIQGVRFYAEKVTDFAAMVDGLYFGHGRWRNIVQDAVVSQPAYEIREMVHVDDKLESDVQCQMRGESLLWQLKTAPTRLDVTTLGNINILIGDRLAVTLAPENITAAAYDVVTVEHSIDSENGFRTKTSMVNSSDIRVLPSITTAEVMVKEHKRVLDINRGVQNRW